MFAVIVHRTGITRDERFGVQYWHYATQGDKNCGYIRIPALYTKKKTLTKKKLVKSFIIRNISEMLSFFFLLLQDILVLKGSVLVVIGENRNVAGTGDQIRINEGK